MKKHRNKIIAALIIIIVLAASFFWGEAPDTTRSDNAVNTPAVQDIQTASPLPTEVPQTSPAPSPEITPTLQPAPENPEATPADDTSESDGEKEVKPSPTPNSVSQNPPPVDAAEVTDKMLSCTLSVTCHTILDNMDKLDSNKHGLVPSDGVIFASKKVNFYEGESVFNVLQREMKRAKIHMEFTTTPIYSSAYIEGINNLYEFDCGELSGWVYFVNGWSPNYGCSRYLLKDGDVIEWKYTCNLGKDIGASDFGGQNE